MKKYLAKVVKCEISQNTNFSENSPGCSPSGKLWYYNDSM